MQSIMATLPAIFKWRQTEPGLILCAVRWYLRYSLSFRDVEELLEERGLKTDHTTVWRWVQCYAPELEQRLRGYLKPTSKSWRVDETYIRVKGRWSYLYRAIDSTGASIDFLLSAFRDAEAAKRLFRKALSHASHPQPRVINTDRHRSTARHELSGSSNTYLPGARTFPTVCNGTLLGCMSGLSGFYRARLSRMSQLTGQTTGPTPLCSGPSRPPVATALL